MEGQVVRSWTSDCYPGHRAISWRTATCCARLRRPRPAFRRRPGRRRADPGVHLGRRARLGFQVLPARTSFPHHDIAKLPNGNVLMIVWDKKTAEEAIAAGRRPELVGDRHLLPDSIVEVKPTGKTTGEVVWEWHLWDHLIQDHDTTKANYGDVAAHPELVDINFGTRGWSAACVATKAGVGQAQGRIGYVGGTPKDAHATARSTRTGRTSTRVAYNAELDQIVISVHEFSEFWIIDHSTTTAEAAGHTGGRSGKGGDLLYRWGNPRAYRAGTSADQKLFAPAQRPLDPQGLPGRGARAGLQQRRPAGPTAAIPRWTSSSCRRAKGQYAREPGTAFGPDKAVWSYSAPKKSDFYSFFISGAQRLPNGNTLICSGTNGTLFEVTPDQGNRLEVREPGQGQDRLRPGFGPPKPGELLPCRSSGTCWASRPSRRRSSDKLQKTVDGRDRARS